MEAEKAQLVQQKEVVFSSREVLQEKVSQLRQEVESATVSIDQAEDQLVDLVKEVRSASANLPCERPSRKSDFTCLSKRCSDAWLSGALCESYSANFSFPKRLAMSTGSVFR